MSTGIPSFFLHGASGGEGYTDEIITFELLVGLVIGMALLVMWRARKNKNSKKPRNRRGGRR